MGFPADLCMECFSSHYLVYLNAVQPFRLQCSVMMVPVHAKSIGMKDSMSEREIIHAPGLHCKVLYRSCVRVCLSVCIVSISNQLEANQQESL